MMNVFTVPNFITFLRIPLMFVFFQENTALRLLALFLAMLSDGLDGYIARKYSSISRFGTFLDPFADKFFVIGVLSVFVNEGSLNLFQVFAMLSRDFAVLIFGCYLICKGTFSQYQFRAIRCGKMTTALQFIVLLGLIFHVTFPPTAYFAFVVLGIAALGELYLELKKT